MSNNTFNLSRLTLCMGAIAGFAISAPTLAQTDSIEEEAEVITITGSRIKRQELTTSSPVTVLDKVAIERSGVSTVGELLLRLPSVVGSPASPRSGGNNNGAATVRLRGLSSNNTLVLINGRRVSTRGVSSSVDLETIPFDAVERVEVLKDGASAVYGSDAIAGVVNLIMRSDYDGLKINLEAGESRHGDAGQKRVSFTFGGNTDKANWLVSASHFNDDGWMRRDRDISSEADLRRFGEAGTNLRSSKSPRSWIFSTDYERLGVTAADGATWNPTTGYDVNDFRAFNGYWSDAPTDAAHCGASALCDSFNYHDYETGSNEYQSTTVWVSGEYEIAPDTSLFMEYNSADVNSINYFAPGALEFGDNIIVSKNNQYNPFDEDVIVQRRITENGILRPRDADSDVDRFTFGLKGSIEDWDYDFVYSHQRSKVVETRGKQMSLTRLRAAAGDSQACLDRDDGCVPLDLIGPYGSVNEEMMSYIFSHKPTSIYDNTLRFLNANITGAPFELPAGPVYIATGAEVRWEDASVTHDVGLNTGDVAFIEQVSDTTAPTRKIEEAYIEAVLPLLSDMPLVESLELELAVRYSRYSDFGNTTNPKVGLKWQVNPDLLVRYSYSEGFRAPTFGELYTPSQKGFVNDTDPCTTDNWSNLAGCSVRAPGDLGYTAVTGGNQDLEAEEAESFTTGFVWTPESLVDGLSITFDYWSIEQTNVVATYGATRKVSENAANPALWSNTVIRNPSSGAIVEVRDIYENVDRRELSGWELEGRYDIKNTQSGDYSVQLGVSKLKEWVDIEIRSGEENRSDATGLVTGGASYPELKVSGALNWTLDNWSASWNMSYIDSLVDDDNDVIERPKVDDYIKHDLQVSYQLPDFWESKLTFGIDNVFDQDPPILASTVDGGHDPSTYSARGRYFYGRVSFSF
ncbi:TonB-dependent receptor [Pseudoalteromonas sp. JBTF-M23]|uniref:TonB-dependent receptor n=1 Tax=Pseudoalteromonas caenipelagi TaxID=2726988 RepID=A0A849VIF8_9GAMM|nr:TonB-dependent receptor [Pseudoalteromonas caenipelagi]NOU51447.1 TonB-dependent receptor [Pseudoalteromonas caenipelagi]